MIPELPEALQTLGPDLQRGRDGLKGGNLRLRKQLHPVAVEEEAEIRREPFRLFEDRRHHEERPLEPAGHRRQHERPRPAPQPGQAEHTPLQRQILKPLLEAERL